MDRFEEPPIDYSEDETDDRSSSSPDNQAHFVTMINFDNLQLDDLIGQGGFGKVYRARLKSRIVAVKEPIYYASSMIRSINQQIFDEASIHFQLNHSNIIQLYGISLNNDKVYLVMEYAHGGSLRELISQRTLSPNVIIKFAIQIANAMEYLHSFKPKAIIHRDLKSPNILLNEPILDGDDLVNKQLKLTDLGLAREFTHSTHMTTCGTYAWMAPETITDSKFSKASDVWSFGVVLWELLTGQIPYRDLSAPAIAYGIGNGKLTLPVPATCPEELKCILHACWLPDSRKRPYFGDLLHQLRSSSFNVINLSQFRKMKQAWYEEIESIWRNLKRKEMELATREEETKRKEAEVEMMKARLKQQSEELRKREIDVVSRELHVLLQQQMRDMKCHLEVQQNKLQPKVQQKSVQKQQQQVGKTALKKRHLTSQTEISSPKDFCHNLTITTTHEDYAIPFLKAKALNQTWGPGSKHRSDLLNFELFDLLGQKSKKSSKEHGEQIRSSTVTLSRKNSLKTAKKIPSFLKKFFRTGSKRSKGRLDASTFTEPFHDDNKDDDHDDDENDDDDVDAGQRQHKDGEEISDVEEEYNNNTEYYCNDEEYDGRFLPKYIAYSSKDVSFNRTYHGQTKYSQRRRNLAMDIAQHFQSLEGNENDHDDEDDDDDDDDQQYSTNSDSHNCPETSDYHPTSPTTTASSTSSSCSESSRTESWSNGTPLYSRTTQTASSYPTSSSSCPASKGYSSQQNVPVNRSKSSCSAINLNYNYPQASRIVSEQRFKYPGEMIHGGRSAPEVRPHTTIRSLSSEHEFSDDLLREFDKFEQAFASLNTSSRALASM